MSPFFQKYKVFGDFYRRQSKLPLIVQCANLMNSPLSQNTTSPILQAIYPHQFRLDKPKTPCIFFYLRQQKHYTQVS